MVSTDLDPTNPFTRRDVGTVFSIFYVGGGCADYYQVHNVAHGSVAQVWYHSDALHADRRLSVYLPPHYGESGKKYPVPVSACTEAEAMRMRGLNSDTRHASSTTLSPRERRNR